MGLFSKNSNQPAEAPADSSTDIADVQALALNRLKPHYVNNVLSTIYYLCDAEPEKAQSVITSFSGYLLNTLETMKSQDPVPFNWELGLIRNYLALEKIRFENKLNIAYDVDFNDFEVTPMSVLLLVENAVKQGIAQLDHPGTLRISTRRLPGGGVKISVMDDGLTAENSPNRQSDEARRDFDTVRRLLERSLGGELSVVSTDSETIASITIEG